MPIFSSKLPDIHIPTDISFPEFILQNIRTCPASKELLLDAHSKRTCTAQQVLDTVNKVSTGFCKKGLKIGDVVAILLPNIIEYPLIICGVQNLGGIVTTLNPQYTPEEIAFQLNDTGPKFIITTPQLMEKVSEVVSKTKTPTEVIVIGEHPSAFSFSSLIDNDGQFTKVKFDPRTTVSFIPYSSGTTGFPKGVELTHYNLIANALQVLAIQVGVYRDGDILINFVPFFHLYGATVVLVFALYNCYPLIIMQRFDLPLYLQYIQDYKVTCLTVVPPVAIQLTQSELVKKYDTSSVRVISCGATSLALETERALKARFPHSVLVQLYGMTEASPGSHTTNVFTTARNSVGQLAPNMKMKIVDIESGKELGVGQRGEIWIKGPNIMKGYLNNPKATAETIDKDGYLHTGDIGYVDSDLNLFIEGRLKELIKYNGFQVAPAELEAVLLEHPDIADVAVVGKPDKEAGELPMAFVILKSGSKTTENNIIEWAAKKTAHYKKLRGGIRFVDSIPKSASGKILRRELSAKL